MGLYEDSAELPQWPQLVVHVPPTEATEAASGGHVQYMYMYMYACATLHLYMYMYIALLCCLFNLACIFLPSFSSLIIKNIYKHDLYTCIYMNIHVYTV